MVESFKLVKKEVNDKLLTKILDLVPGLNLEKGPWIAGGAVRKMWFNEDWAEGHDLDFFFRVQSQFEDFYDTLESFQTKKINNRKVEVFRTKNAQTYTLCGSLEDEHAYDEIKVQIINRQFYQSYEEMWRDFDFTVCNFVTDGKIMIADENAIKHCEEKKLVFNLPRCRKLDGRRVVKYNFYGFEPEKNIVKETLDQYFEDKLTDGWEDDYR